MFLKSLVIRGFKSFADKTNLAFEPGISVVVGPNGSGKSNIIDAISWVLGEQGPAALRGGKMEDVIFAGSATRPPLGMAEVALTIDNSARLLPVEFTEVTISRTLFRSGDSEYRMNGGVCRLLDIQEMLSDAGVGREQHTIVGQGRLDEVLGADAVEMRNMIEDAAGVGKHRRRKERALRKIAATDTNLEHLGDLLSEIRRQLKPLRQQAEIAERHRNLREELHRIKLVLASRQLAALRSELGSPEAARNEDDLRRAAAAVSQLEAELAEMESRRLAQLGVAARRREVSWRLSASLDRLTSLRRLCEERARALRAELSAASEEIEQARLAELRHQQTVLEAALAGAQAEEAGALATLDQVQAASDQARRDLAAAEETLRTALREQAEASGQAAALRRGIAGAASATKAAEIERSRLAERAAGAELRRRQNESRLEAAQLEVDLASAAMAPAEDGVRAAESHLDELQGLRERLLEEIRGLEKQIAVMRARAGATSPEAGSRDGLQLPPAAESAWLSDLAGVPPEYRRSLEALLGPLDRVAVAATPQSAWEVVRGEYEGEPPTVVVSRHGAPVEAAQRLVDRLGVDDPGVERALGNVYLAGDGAQAAALARRHPHAIFLSDDGTVAHGAVVARGSMELPSAIAGLEQKVAAGRQAMEDLQTEIAAIRERVKEAVAHRRDAEAVLVRAAEHLRARQSEASRLKSEIQEIARASRRSEESGAAKLDRSRSLEAALEESEAAVVRAEAALPAARAERERRSSVYEAAARRSEAARMDAGIAAERTRQYVNRLKQVVEEISEAAGRLSGLGSRQESLLAARKQASAVAAACDLLAGPVGLWAAEARAAHEEAVGSAAELDRGIADLKERMQKASGDLQRLREVGSREDLRRSEMRIRQRILEAAMTDEMQVDPSQAVERWGTQRPLPGGESPEDPMERAASLPDEALRKRLARLERELEQMGIVNPLAAREAEALAERESFLADQITDLRESRKDLRQVVASVDERIRELFTAAFDDIAAEYANLFSLLFPQGKGCLRLTDPTEILESGVEVEASPSGKNLRRLSLLSGGERALSALALLFAIFKCRPSPFYILDEVEAALDDVNLQRFLTLLQDFRGSSQLLVVTHQKRTMETADVLYGVSMRRDGVSKVISERLHDFFPVSMSASGSGIGVDLA